MAPRTGRPTNDKKTERLEIRLTEQESDMLKECAERIGASKTDVIIKGILLVKAELDRE